MQRPGIRPGDSLPEGAPRLFPLLELSGFLPYGSAVPIYEFHCQGCGKDSEVLVRSTNWEGTPCPHCGSTKLEKKLSVFASTPSGGGAEAPACDGNPASCSRCAYGGARSE
jgi:putative FmdB family regulatory protein